MLGLAFAAMGLGIFITLRIFDIPDITTDGSYTLGGAITAVLLLAQWPLLAILGLALLGGALAGMITGIIHTRLRVNALLAGILVMTALYSVNLEVMGKSNLPLLEVQNFLHLLQFMGLGAGLSGLLVLLLVGLMLWGALSYLLRTDFGLAMRATGNAEAMIRANGVNTDRMKIIGLALANALTALSGFLVVQYQGFADINMGIGIVIVGLGSVVIGETLSRWTGQHQIGGRILGVILGTIVFRLILALALAAGVHPNWLKLLTSAFVLLVVALPNLRWKG
ncbi:MAG: ABC transporter permease [Microscillaceae bacterium]|nr:ABC transporter permease [Microscillaceae bacterium]